MFFVKINCNRLNLLPIVGNNKLEFTDSVSVWFLLVQVNIYYSEFERVKCWLSN